MPKLKTHSGAKKRFKMTKKGKIKRAQAFRRHILNKKSTKRKRLLRKAAYVHGTNLKALRKLDTATPESTMVIREAPVFRAIP